MQKKRRPSIIATHCCLILAMLAFTGSVRAQEHLPANATPAVQTETPAAKPVIFWYSRSGHSQLVAEALQKQLGCDMEKIASQKDRGFFTIVGEQIFGASDDQEAAARDLGPYTAVIIAAPIYFMKLSAPARAFMEKNKAGLKGKDIYIFVTMGGKLPDGKIKAIKEFGAGLGLTVKEVYSLQIGQKEEFPQRISEILKAKPLQAAAH